MKKLLPVLGIILLLLISCKEKVKPGSVEVKRAPVTGVTLVSVSLQEVESYYETAGTTRARTTSVLASRTMGTVQSIDVKEGDRVRPGQVLMMLDDRDATQRVIAAESGYNEALKALDEAGQNRSLADVTYKRYRNLYNDKVISQQEMDQVETQKKVADAGYERVGEMVNRTRAQLEEARINKGFTKITAPHEGIITEKRIEQGSLATPGTPLLVLEETSLFKVDAYIDERLAGKIKIGMPVTILLASEGRPIVGTIGEIVPAVDPATRTFPVKVFLKDPSLRSGPVRKDTDTRGEEADLACPG